MGFLMKNKECKSGFTLVEVLLAVMLVGIAIAGIVSANGYLTRLNGAGVELSTAEFLVEQIRERTAGMGFSSIVSLNGKTYSPPEDSAGEVLNDFADYMQVITAVHVSNADLTQINGGGNSDFIRVTVDVYQDNMLISSGSWVRADY